MLLASTSSSPRPDNARSLRFARASLAIATLLWAGNFIVGRALRHDMAPLELNFWRWLIALAALLPLTLGSLWIGRALILRNTRLIALLALTGVVVPHACVYTALATTHAVNALLLMSLTPLLVSLGDRAVFGEPLRQRQWLGMAVACAGAITVITHGTIDTLATLQLGRGDLWMVPAILGAAAHTLLLKRSPVSIAQAPLLTASVIAALVMMLPLLLLSDSLRAPPSDFRTVASLLYVGVLASAVAFLLWNRGVTQLGPAGVAPFLYLMPVYGSILSALLLGEAVMGFQYLGGAMVLAGLWLARRQRLS